MPKHDYRIGRGEILRMLYRCYPDAVGDNVIKSTFIWITPGVIEGHVQFLIDSNYAVREMVDHEKFEFSTADYILKIVPKGIDLLEGNIDKDPGIQNPPL
jgi:hypothetical protein